MPSAVAPVFVARIVRNGIVPGGSPDDFSLDPQNIASHGDAEKSHLSPVFAPAVANDPILPVPIVVVVVVVVFPIGIGIGILAPPRYGHRVGSGFGIGIVGIDPAGVVCQSVSVDGGHHGSPSKNLRLDRLNQALHIIIVVVIVIVIVIVVVPLPLVCNIGESVVPVLGHGRVRQRIDLAAGPPVLHKGIAGPAGVDPLARRVDVGTKSLDRFGTAGQIGHAGLVRNHAGVVL
mmetsp:Transcript_2573/g.6832  ORF Transcript_2573/g.6832 Transcript_2573/m.6832 type:complete len:233 (+) Transcript_2573:247-945(+)